MPIPTRPFGSTGLDVSLLGYGSASIWGDLNDRSRRAHDQIEDAQVGLLLNALLDSGVTLIDTAGMYGLSERRIGRHISHRRGEFVLSSKCGYDNEGNVDWSDAGLTAGIERSLRDLRTDVIDVMHLHSCSLTVLEKGEAVSALERAVRSGKVRFAAYSGDNEALSWAVESGRFASLETSLNVCDQRVLDRIIPQAAARGMGVIVKRPIANAFWKFSEQPKGKYCEKYWLRARAMELGPADFNCMDWHELFLRFSAFQPGVSSCIVGTSSLEHFRANTAVLEKGPLPAGTVSALRALFRAHDQDWVGLQ